MTDSFALKTQGTALINHRAKLFTISSKTLTTLFGSKIKQHN